MAGKREVGIEKFSALRTLAAIEEADVCALLVDATEPHAKLDQTLAGQIINAGKGIIVVLTKSDLVTDTDRILDRLEQDFNFLPTPPSSSLAAPPVKTSPSSLNSPPKLTPPAT